MDPFWGWRKQNNQLAATWFPVLEMAFPKEGVISSHLLLKRHYSAHPIFQSACPQFESCQFRVPRVVPYEGTILNRMRAPASQMAGAGHTIQNRLFKYAIQYRL